jgi:cell division transport system permease protein
MTKKERKISGSRLRSSYFTTIISVALVLFCLGIVGFLILNAQKVSEYVKENIGFAVYIKNEAKEVDIIRLQKLLDAKKYVKSTRYVSKEEAAEELKKELGEDFVEWMGYNPLPPSIDVYLFAEYAHTDSVPWIHQDLMHYQVVEEVDYQEDMLVLINDNVEKISFIIIGFSFLLFLIALTLIHNTIRLSVYSKRFIISTMQLVGATNGFIRRPFLRKAVIIGLLAAIIAISLLTGFIYLADQQVKGVLQFQDYTLLAILYAAVALTGVVLNYLSTFFAVNKYLKMKIDDLYF